MSAQWRSGTRMRLLDVCRADLVTVRLRWAGVGVPDERPSDDGRVPHLVYEPSFAGRDGGAGTIGGDAPTATQPFEYRVDLDPLWCPYPGTLSLDGGGRGGLFPEPYLVTYTRARCAPRPDKDPTFTLIKARDASVLPLGIYAASAPNTEIARFTFNGLFQDLSLERNPTHLGTFAQGSVGPSPFGSPSLNIVSFLVHL